MHSHRHISVAVGSYRYGRTGSARRAGGRRAAALRHWRSDTGRVSQIDDSVYVRFCCQATLRRLGHGCRRQVHDTCTATAPTSGAPARADAYVVARAHLAAQNGLALAPAAAPVGTARPDLDPGDVLPAPIMHRPVAAQAWPPLAHDVGARAPG